MLASADDWFVWTWAGGGDDDVLPPPEDGAIPKLESAEDVFVAD